MSKTKYTQKYNGELSQYDFEDFVFERDGIEKDVRAVEVYTECCDCGLVHRRVFYIEKGKLSMVGWRDNRRTAQRKRYKRGKK